MEIQKLKKRLLKEELRRQRKNSKLRRMLIPGILLGLVLLFGGLFFYLSHFDSILEEDYQQAESALAGGDYEKALAGFEAIYRRHPTFHLAPQALFQSAEILNLYQRRYQQALLCYLLVEKEYPGNELAVKAQLQVADLYKNRLQDYEHAIATFRKLLEKGQGEADQIQYEIADAYFRLEDFDQARSEFETLYRRYPRSPLLAEVRYRIGVTYSLEGDTANAVRTFRDVVKSWPESPYAVEARFSLAGTLEERDELQAASDELRQLRGVYPNAEALEKKLEQVQRRIDKKKRAI